MPFRQPSGGGGGPHALNDGAVHTGALAVGQLPGTAMLDAEHLAALHEAGGVSDLTAYFSRRSVPGSIFFGPPAGVTGGSQWTNQPAGESAWAGAALMLWRGALDTMSQVRWQGNVWNAGAAGALVVLSYTTDFAAWNDIATEELTVHSFDTGWDDLPAGAKVDPVGIMIRGRGGNAAADPAIEQISVSFR